MAEAREAGIESVSLDLLYDVPGGSQATWMATLEGAVALAPDHLSLYALTLDDPDAEGLTGPGGDHLPTTSGARRWREAALKVQDEDRATAQYHHAVHLLGGGGLARLRDLELGATRAREPPQPRLLGTPALRGRGARRPCLRRHEPALECRPTRRVPGRARLIGGRAAASSGREQTLDEATAAAERVILGLRTDRGLPLAEADQGPLAESFGWALAMELLEVTGDGRMILTTRGRLLSNELFARLV